MTELDSLVQALESRGGEIAALWRRIHVDSVAAGPDREAVELVHGRAPALVEALARALGSDSPAALGSFAHREAIQVVTMMAHALAESGAAASAAGALVPALGAALERMELPGAAATLVHLAAVAAEGFSASTLSRLSRDQQRRLAAATPVFALPGETVLVAATGLPDAGSVEAVVDRATRLALGLERPSVIVDLSHLGEVGPEALSGLLALADDVERLGGRCVVTGLSERLERAAAEAGVDLAALATRTDVSAALPDAMGKRGPFKRARNR